MKEQEKDKSPFTTKHFQKVVKQLNKAIEWKKEMLKEETTMNKENAAITKLLARAQLHLQNNNAEHHYPMIKEWIIQGYNIGAVESVKKALESSIITNKQINTKI